MSNTSILSKPANKEAAIERVSRLISLASHPSNHARYRDLLWEAADFASDQAIRADIRGDEEASNAWFDIGSQLEYGYIEHARNALRLL